MYDPRITEDPDLARTLVRRQDFVLMRELVNTDPRCGSAPVLISGLLEVVKKVPEVWPYAERVAALFRRRDLPQLFDVVRRYMTVEHPFAGSGAELDWLQIGIGIDTITRLDGLFEYVDGGRYLEPSQKWHARMYTQVEPMMVRLHWGEAQADAWLRECIGRFPRPRVEELAAWPNLQRDLRCHFAWADGEAEEPIRFRRRSVAYQLQETIALLETSARSMRLWTSKFMRLVRQERAWQVEAMVPYLTGQKTGEES